MNHAPYHPLPFRPLRPNIRFQPFQPIIQHQPHTSILAMIPASPANTFFLLFAGSLTDDLLPSLKTRAPKVPTPYFHIGLGAGILCSMFIALVIRRLGPWMQRRFLRTIYPDPTGRWFLAVQMLLLVIFVNPLFAWHWDKHDKVAIATALEVGVWALSMIAAIAVFEKWTKWPIERWLL
ncbi:hypothetical protein DL96DRAFT_1717084 [Flagelloscypha sp. PMI_526]|nr:hypothetical protein DL96DRAFT_1717084 [Flagelloscypha sp. PMI_526]